MWPAVIFAAGPVRHMSVRAGVRAGEIADNHGQHPCGPRYQHVCLGHGLICGQPGRASHPAVDQRELPDPGQRRAQGGRQPALIGELAQQRRPGMADQAVAASRLADSGVCLYTNWYM